MQSLQLSWDSYPAYGKTLDDLDMHWVEKFIDKVNTTGRFHLLSDVKSSLEKLKLINGNEITNAAWLLFGKGNIGYNIHLGRFKTFTFIIDDRMFNAALFQAVDDIMQYIIAQIKVAFEITGKTTQRTEIFEYPLAAIREITLNCIIHRDYRSPIDVQIKIFDNYISFFNPGKLMGDLTVDDLQYDNYRAYSINKLIAEAFYLTGDIEKYGSGFLRVRNEISTYPTMKLIVEEISNGFHAQLGYTDQKTSTVIKEGDRFSINQQAILEAMKINPRITIPELSTIVGINETNIQKNLKKLRDIKKINRVGSARGGYWQILD
ncbi:MULTISPECIES: ATP-binding protein [Sphingobacterium]|uniref:ATP-binding protein n=1 Tax=Sphingobacterium TaxID=28453 RepID=UPI0013DAEC06|nr:MULTISPECIES: ATP-binding protein [unclassified Sphingobacterium]